MPAHRVRMHAIHMRSIGQTAPSEDMHAHAHKVHMHAIRMQSIEQAAPSDALYLFAFLGGHLYGPAAARTTATARSAPAAFAFDMHTIHMHTIALRGTRVTTAQGASL